MGAEFPEGSEFQQLRAYFLPLQLRSRAIVKFPESAVSESMLSGLRNDWFPNTRLPVCRISLPNQRFPNPRFPVSRSRGFRILTFQSSESAVSEPAPSSFPNRRFPSPRFPVSRIRAFSFPNLLFHFPNLPFSVSASAADLTFAIPQLFRLTLVSLFWEGCETQKEAP